jgi:MFS family permease
VSRDDRPGEAWLWLRVFAPFALGYYLSYALRTVNAVIAPELTRELSLSASDLGLLTSTYFLSFAVFQIPLGLLLDRFGARRVEAGLLLLAAAGSGVFALGESLTNLGVGRALIGLGVSACLMASFKSFHQWFSAERQASLVGAIMVAGGLGALSASVPLELSLPVLGWRGVFWGLVGLSLLVAVAVFTVPDRMAGISTEGLGEALRGIGNVLANRVFWRYAPLNLVGTGGFMALQALWAVPWLIHVNGYTRSEAAQHLFLMSLALLAGYLLIAAFSTRLARRGIPPLRLFVGGMLSGWTIALLIVAGLGPTWLLWILYGFALSSANLSYPLVTAAFPPQYSGRVNTAYNLMAFVGAFSIQWGFGALVDLLNASGLEPRNAYRATFATLLAMQLASYVWFAVSGRGRTKQGA